MEKLRGDKGKAMDMCVQKLKADFHSVQFIERTEFCDRISFKCVQSVISNEIRST